MSNRVTLTPKRFGIPSPEWTGLAKVAEEAAEVIQQVMKIMATGGKMKYENGNTVNPQLLFEELGDLQAAIDFFVAMNRDMDEMDAYYQNRSLKLAKFSKWYAAEHP